MAALVALVLPASMAAAPGDLDRSFSGDGRLKLKPRRVDQLYGAYATAIQPGGRIVVTGESHQRSTGSDFTISALRPSGRLDRSFGTEGHTSIHLEYWEYGTDLAIQPDGKIVVSGFTENTGSGADLPRLVALRLRRNGTPDPTFGTDGIAQVPYSRFPFNGGYQRLLRVALDIDTEGRIVLGATTWGGRDKDFGVARFTPEGRLDSRFAGDGVWRLDYRKRDSVGDVAIDRRDRIVVSGQTKHGRQSDFALVRLRPSGKLDRSFSGNGRRSIDLGPYAGADTVAVRGNGALVVGGGAMSRHGHPTKAVVVRLAPDGSVADSFADDGVRRIRLRDYVENVDLELQRDGRIVFSAAAARVSGGLVRDYDFAVARLKRGGNLDRSFSENGRTFTEFGRSEFPFDADLQANGRIVVAGLVAIRRYYPPSQPRSVALARYRNNGRPAR